MDLRFTGKGPGEQAPDGCSVELYLKLPYLGDLEPVHQFLNANASILELGCGTGITRSSRNRSPSRQSKRCFQTLVSRHTLGTESRTGG